MVIILMMLPITTMINLTHSHRRVRTETYANWGMILYPQLTLFKLNPGCALCLVGSHQPYTTPLLIILSFSESGPRFKIKTVFPGMGIPMIKIRPSRDCIIFNMTIPMLVRRHLYIETARRWSFHQIRRIFLRSRNALKSRNMRRIFRSYLRLRDTIRSDVRTSC